MRALSAAIWIGGFLRSWTSSKRNLGHPTRLKSRSTASCSLPTSPASSAWSGHGWGIVLWVTLGLCTARCPPVSVFRGITARRGWLPTRGSCL
jgi:hypothetical protein